MFKTLPLVSRNFYVTLRAYHFKTAIQLACWLATLIFRVVKQPQIFNVHSPAEFYTYTRKALGSSLGQAVGFPRPYIAPFVSPDE
jgi:hypothetical protein